MPRTRPKDKAKRNASKPEYDPGVQPIPKNPIRFPKDEETEKVILEFLKEHKDVYQTGEIAEAIGIDRRIVRRSLYNLRNEGKIGKVLFGKSRQGIVLSGNLIIHWVHSDHV